MELFKLEALQSVSVFIVLFVLRMIITYSVRRFSERKNKVKKRANLIMKYVDAFFIIIAIIISIFIWGIKIKDIGVIASSVFAIIGVGFFAQWSVLSNLTSGVIIFFTLPYKIGDRIKIHDKDFPIIATIEDIKAFHTNLRTGDGGLHTYPNNLILQKGITLVEEGVATNILEQNEKIDEDDPFNKAV